MNVTMTYVTVAAQPGWFLTVFTSNGGIDRYEPIIAWEIQRIKRPNGLVTRFPIPITAESKNTDLDCAIWGIKRPDGKFVFPVGENERVSEENLSKFALSMESKEMIEKLAFGERSNVDERPSPPLEVVIGRSAMMRFVFPVLFSVMIAMIFVSFYAWLSPPLQLGTGESDLPKPSRSNPLLVVTAASAPAPDVTPLPVLVAVAAAPAAAPDVAPEPALAAVAATPSPAPDVTPEPALAAVAATPAPAPDVTPEPALAAAAATPTPAPDVTPEPQLDAAPKAQLTPVVLPKVKPAAGPARAEAAPKKKRVTATGPTGAAGATTGREPARPRERDFGQAVGELPPQ